MSNSIKPVAFKGVVTAAAYRIPETIDEKLIQNIINGTVNVHDVMKLPAFARSEEILTTGALAIEKLGTEKSVNSFFKAITELNVTLHITNWKKSSSEPSPALAGSDAQFDTALKTGFANIAKHIQNSAGELAPQNWHYQLINNLNDVGVTLGQDLARQYVLDLSLSIAKANRNTNDRSDSSSIASNLYDLSTKDPSDLAKMIDAFPAVALQLSPTWFPDSKKTLLTEKLAKQALHLMSSGIQNGLAEMNKENLREKCSLDWLSPKQVSNEIKRSKMSVARFAEFSTATAEQFHEMVDSLMRVDQHSNNNWASSDLRNLPIFEKYAGDTNAIKHFFQRDIGSNAHVVDVSRRMTYLRVIADAQPSSEIGQALLHKALSASFLELNNTTNLVDKHQLAYNLIELSMNTLGARVYGHPSDKPYRVSADLQVLATLIKGANMGQLLDDETKANTDNYVRARAEYSGVSKEDQMVIRQAFIESGATSLGSLPRKDLTAKLIGSTLEQSPERLAEVTHFNDFMKLANMYKIPVDIPVEIQEAAKRSSKAIKAINAIDPMAELDAKKPVKKRITI